MHGRKLITTGTVAALAILAVVGGCREATTGPTTVRPQDFASSLKLLSGNQQTGAVGVPLSELLSVKVVDAGGQAVAGATVLWQVRDGGGTISPAASTSSVSGLATVTWTLGTTLGANKVVAILQGNYALDSAVFTATAKTGAANQFTATAGNLQSGRVASRLATPLTVNVKDQFGYPVVGARVVWAPGNIFSGTVVAVNDSTDASGNASANWTLGSGAIAQTATATVTGLPPIVFNATGTADLSRRVTLSVVTGFGVKDPAGASIPVSVIVTDSFANPIKGDAVVFNDQVTGGGTVVSAVPTTDAAGRSQGNWTLGARVGAQTLRARVGSTPSNVATDTATVAFAQVVAGNYFTCGITITDRALCWGFGADGQRGVPVANTSFAPSVPATSGDTLEGPFKTWRQLDAGRSYTCGIDITRQLYCWGRLANSLQINVPTQQVLTGKVLNFASVSTSEGHSCVLATSGLLACTGANGRGQLGDGTQLDQLAGTYVISAGTDSLFSSVVTGGSHTCAFPRYNPADSTNTKTPRCWGGNGSGQLGRGTISTQGLTIVKITLPNTSTRFDSASIVAGNAHTCVLGDSASASPGVTYCWGSNGYGQLGKAVTSTALRDSVAQPVAGVPAFVKLYAGEYHTCGITSSGATWCWGRNDSGQLGRAASLSGVPDVINGVTFRSLALGELHSCGVVGTPPLGGSGTQTTKGEVRCWGDNEYGQLGRGVAGANGVPDPTPRKVAGQP